ncbi:hypothetical protein Neut_0824 [Nitrosomonas eutropha C91]|uniref:Uncharacterized protein n=1 Tax=Nitrosomonas eutropha (strain DSM 101675 / C91 / Nm57) TaxID=335283 RepID=Q0AHU4_NITEC|nr:hypothetical protein Neut_0824 [Nitrosomonas eutropha C91]
MSFNPLSVCFAEDNQVGDSSTKTLIVNVNAFNNYQIFKKLYRDFRLFWQRLVLAETCFGRDLFWKESFKRKRQTLYCANHV